MSAFGQYGPSCSAASASADPTALVASLLVSLRPLRPSCTSAFGLDRPDGPCGPRERYAAPYAYHQGLLVFPKDILVASKTVIL